ncbi:hypothetical protein BH09SUM1_BH09SUM1_08610 [soil metagenome]
MPLTRRTVFISAAVLCCVAPVILLAVLQYQRSLERSAYARARSDLRSLATAIECYYVDNMQYPSDSVARKVSYGAGQYPPGVATPRTFMVAGASSASGITTPVAYIDSFPDDRFATYRHTTYSYYCAHFAYIMGSWGPDEDQPEGGDAQWQRGTHGAPFTDPGIEQVYSAEIAQPSAHLLAGSHEEFGQGAFNYDPTNGVYSQGDILRWKQ